MQNTRIALTRNECIGQRSHQREASSLSWTRRSPACNGSRVMVKKTRTQTEEKQEQPLHKGSSSTMPQREERENENESESENDSERDSESEGRERYIYIYMTLTTKGIRSSTLLCDCSDQCVNSIWGIRALGPLDLEKFGNMVW